MEFEWPLERIDDVAEKIAMGPFGSSIKVETFVPAGIPVISGQHLQGSRLDDTRYNFISIEHADRLANANVQRGDVIFTHAGNIGQVALIPNNSKYDRYVISQRQFYLRCNVKKIIPEFITYFFKTREGQHRLLANTSSSGVPSIAQPVSYLKTILVPAPPLSEQKAIAHILSTLDDKIELNRKMNQTFEDIAQVVFKSWFVDFDPVRAKVEGRDTGLPEYISVLFPDSFEDSELGQVPLGWNIMPLGELTNLTKGVSYRSSELTESDTALVTLKSFARGGGYRPEGLKSFSGAYKANQVVTPGEVVVACTDVTQAAEVVGRPAMVRPSSNYETLVASLDTLIIRPKDERLTSAFLYCLCGLNIFTAHTYAHTTGTTVLHLASNAVPSFRLALPSPNLVQAFNKIAVLLLTKIQNAEQESETLANLHDSLLPKLVSGELRVQDVERIIKGVD